MKLRPPAHSMCVREMTRVYAIWHWDFPIPMPSRFFCGVRLRCARCFVLCRRRQRRAREHRHPCGRAHGFPHRQPERAHDHGPVSYTHLDVYKRQADASDAAHGDVAQTVRAYQARDARIVYTKVENKGISANTNAAAALAAGEYLSLIHI